MQDLARFVLAGLEYNRIQAASNPSNCDKLLGRIAAMIQVIGLLSCFFEPDAAARVRPQSPALLCIEAKAHYGITVIPLHWRFADQGR